MADFGRDPRSSDSYFLYVGFTSHSANNRSFRRRSLEPMSWLGTKEVV